MRRLTARERRLSSLLLLIVVIGIVSGIIVRPVLNMHAESREAITKNYELLMRYQRIAAVREQLRQKLRALERDSLVRGAYLTGGSEAMVAAQLQNRAKSIVQRAGGQFNSVQILPTEEENGFKKITVRIKAIADIYALSKTFLEIESKEPLLFFKNVDITVRSASRRNANAPVENVKLSMTLDVYGYLRSN